MRTLIVTVLLLIIPALVLSQNNSNPTVKTLLSLQPVAMQDYRKHGVERNSGGDAQLYMLGFNQKGHLAYLTGRIPGMESMPEWTLVIQDLVTDRQILSLVFEEPSSDDLNYKDFIKQSGKVLSSSLKKHGITISSIKLDRFPGLINGDRVHVHIVKKKAGAGADKYGPACYEAVFISKKFGEKIISSLNCDTETETRQWEILGYIRCPRNKRIAVIARQSYYSIEASLLTEFIIMGAKLD